MLKKSALIILGFPNSVDEKETFDYYGNTYKQFFMSNAGGAYMEDEVLILSQPTYLELKDLVLSKKTDFNITVLIGHGATQENNQLFQINENDVIKAGQLNFEIPKQIIILESCRSIENEIDTVNISNKIPLFRNGGTYRDSLSSEESRQIYDEAIKNSESGISMCFACQKGEDAYNFDFSKSLIQNAFDWHLNRQNHLQILKINEAMFLTSIHLLSQKIEQTPEFVGQSKFPFAISKH